MSYHPLKVVKDKKTKLLSSIIRSDEDFPSPLSINEIQQIKESSILRSPALKLTINDFREMCQNKDKSTKLQELLKTDYNQVVKFCSYLNILEENYDNSPQSIHSKMKEKKLHQLPPDIKSLIVSKFSTLFPKKYIFKEWIPPVDKLNFSILCANVNAIDIITEEYNRDPDSKRLDWYNICLNPSLIDIIEKEHTRKPTNINWNILSLNKNAIKLLDQKIHQRENSSTLPLKQQINWNNLGLNPNAVYLMRDKINSEENYRHKAYWNTLCENPNAIDIIRQEYKRKTNRLNWKYISKNPNAIDLIEAKLKEEEDIPIEELNEINTKHKISWRWLSTNPNAIHILSNNFDKIDWKFICENSNIKVISLIERLFNSEKKVIQLIEKTLESEIEILYKYLSINPVFIDYLCNKHHNRIDYEMLCLNFSEKALKLIEKYYKLNSNNGVLDWTILSKNPYIFKELK